MSFRDPADLDGHPRLSSAEAAQFKLLAEIRDRLPAQAVTVHPGGTLILRLPVSFSPVQHQEYQLAAESWMDGTGVKVITLLADEMAVVPGPSGE